MNINTKRWVKWIFIFVIVALFIVLMYFVFLYNQIMSTKTSGYTETEKRISAETEITEIEQITSFHEKNSFHVVMGKTNETEKVAFVPSKNDEPIEVIDKNNIISKNAIKDQWKNECKECDLIKIVPGMINDQPVWEVTYTDNYDRYVFDYLSIHNGVRYEQFRFSTMFK